MAVYGRVGSVIIKCTCPSGDVGVCVDQVVERDLDGSGSGFVEGGELGPCASFREGGPV